MRIARAARRPEAGVSSEIVINNCRDHAITGENECRKSIVPARDDADRGDELDHHRQHEQHCSARQKARLRLLQCSAPVEDFVEAAERKIRPDRPWQTSAKRRPATPSTPSPLPIDTIFTFQTSPPPYSRRTMVGNSRGDTPAKLMHTRLLGETGCRRSEGSSANVDRARVRRTVAMGIRTPISSKRDLERPAMVAALKKGQTGVARSRRAHDQRGRQRNHASPASRRGREGVAQVGALRQRAAMGDGSRGLQREWRAWDYLPHDEARSHAYRWGEDGIGGLCDAKQMLCLCWRCGTGRIPS